MTDIYNRIERNDSQRVYDSRKKREEEPEISAKELAQGKPLEIRYKREPLPKPKEVPMVGCY